MIKLVLRCFAFLAVLWIGGLLFYFAWILRITPYHGRAEGIIVLTGGEHRVEKGLDLLAQGQADHLLISGVNSKVKKTDLLAVNHQPRQLAQKIDLGFSAQDTLGNADEAAQWVHEKELQSLIVVTSNYHMPRALVHLGAELPDIALYPYPVEPDVFGQRYWYIQPTVWKLIVSDYDKFLLTYPQIILTGHVK